jgi:proline iminopeptidase
VHKRLFTVLLFLSGIAVAQQPKVTQGIVHTADVDLSYEIYGTPSKATPLIVIHGGPGIPYNYFLLSDAWSRIAERRQVVFYDQRGVGPSRLLRPDVSQDIAAHVGDLEALRAKLGFEKIALAGHSWGGDLVLAYAASHPEHVKSVVLIDSASPAIAETPFLFSRVFPDLNDKNNKRIKAGEAEYGSLFQYLSMLFYSEDHRDAFISGMKGANMDQSIHEAVIKATEKLNLTPALSNFSFPTMVMHGRYDMNVALVSSWKTYKAIPEATFVVFEKSGHMPFYEEPDKFVQVMNSFLKEHE